jgi:hypothetical protein
MDLNFFRYSNPSANHEASSFYSDAQKTQQKKIAQAASGGTPASPEHLAAMALERSLRASGTPENIAQADRILDNMVHARRM